MRPLQKELDGSIISLRLPTSAVMNDSSAMQLGQDLVAAGPKVAPESCMSSFEAEDCRDRSIALKRNLDRFLKYKETVAHEDT